MQRRNVSFGGWASVAIWAAVILIAATDTFSANNSRTWLELILGSPAPEIVNSIVRKSAHVIEYGILGALAWRASRRLPTSLLVALAVASTDEFRQSFSPVRTGTPWDVLLDVCGAALGVWVMRLWMARREEMR